MTRMTSTALALILAAGTAMAESHSTSTDGAMEMHDSDAKLIRTRDLTGGDVYTLDSKMGATELATGGYESVDDSWEKIGTIEDIVLDSNGQMRGVVAEIGGFLDIGDKHVFLPLNDVKLTPVDDKTYTIVTLYSEEQLEELPSVDEGFWD